MQTSSFKPIPELRFSLQGKERLALFACTVCANLCQTGGRTGLRHMEGILRGMGKEVILSRLVTGCCAETVLREAFAVYLAPVAMDCDAVLMLSCAGGVKTACLISPGIPVVAALDSLGSRPVSRQTTAVAQSACTGCGQCVISHTAGVCPVSACPRGLRFGPCSDAPGKAGDACAVDPWRACIWQEIIAKGADLEELAYLQSRRSRAPLQVPWGCVRPVPALITRPVGWLVARSSGLVARVIPLFD